MRPTDPCPPADLLLATAGPVLLGVTALLLAAAWFGGGMPAAAAAPYGAGTALLFHALATRRRAGRDCASAAAAQAQLATLRSQLDPHFLFNTLNAISTLVVTARPREAEDTLALLAGFLRASLAAQDKPLVRLDTEFEMVGRYLDIERVRFGERLAVHLCCPVEAAAMMVPGFLLQPLAERAVRHAVAPARRTVTIRIDARIDGEALLVTVADDGDASPPIADGGLDAIRARLRSHAGDLAAAPLARGSATTVRLPATHVAIARRAA